MENRINQAFKSLNGKKALITFVTGGDPDMETTKALVYEMEAKGADIIEIGVPFSDPIAEGPVIQAANERAIANGANIETLFECVRAMRVHTQVPIVFLLYFNSILQYEPSRFFKRCNECGVDGIIVPDLPYEERDEIAAIATQHNVIQIALVAPTSNERIEKIARGATGFVYCVSSLGVTGMRNDFQTDFASFIGNVKRVTDTPACIGFGISDAEQAKQIKGFCDGVIIGSAIVKLIADNENNADKIQQVGAFVEGVRRALDEI